MGLWDWIFETLIGGGARTEPDRSHVEPLTSSRETAVATLDEPDEPAVDDADEQPEDLWWRPEGLTVAEPPEIQRPDLSPEARSLESKLIQQFDGHDLTMPPLPRTPERVLQRLRDRKCSFARVADEIAEDQVTAAAVLRAVNSPMYRGISEITSLQLAATRLGVNALRTLMMHQALRAATFLKEGGDKDLADLVWRRSVASACIMSGLAKFTALSEEDAWLTGLLHDVGNVIVLRVVGNHRSVSGYQIDAETFEYLCFESHQEFGELVAEAWNLPPRLKSLLADHHRHPEPDDPLRTERLTIQLSDMIASLLGYAPSVSYDLLATRPAQDLGLAEREDFVAFLRSLPTQVRDAMMYF